MLIESNKEKICQKSFSLLISLRKSGLRSRVGILDPRRGDTSNLVRGAEDAGNEKVLIAFFAGIDPGLERERHYATPAPSSLLRKIITKLRAAWNPRWSGRLSRKRAKNAQCNATFRGRDQMSFPKSSRAASANRLLYSESKYLTRACRKSGKKQKREVPNLRAGDFPALCERWKRGAHEESLSLIEDLNFKNDIVGIYMRACTSVY